MSDKKKPLIAIIEDEVEILNYYVLLLGESYCVSGYEKPENFLKDFPLLLQQDLKIILCDNQLDGLRGIDIISQIRKTAEIPFIICTGLIDSHISNAVDRMGSGIVLEKPIEFEMLIQNIEFMLSKKFVKIA